MKTSKILFAALLLSFNLSNISAQLKVTTDGSVRVGNHGGGTFTVTNNSKSKGFYNQTSNNSSSTMYGFYNQMHSAGTGRKYGIYNYTNQNTSSSNLTYGLYNTTYPRGTGRGYGIYNNLQASNSNSSYGIYNNISSANGGYGIYSRISKASWYNGIVTGLYSHTSVNDGNAAFFNGNVAIWGTLSSISDARTKENIKTLSGALDIIDALKPKTYTYLKDESLNLPQEQQYGFIAQEVEKIMPELIKDLHLPEHKEASQKTSEENVKVYKSVNYIAIIPVLVKAVQEQQELIAKQTLLIQKLEERISK